MEQIELKDDIETDIEIETGHAKTAIDKPVLILIGLILIGILILIGSLIFTPIFDSKDKYSPPEQTHTSESFNININQNFKRFGLETSSPSLDLPSEKLIEALTKILEKTL